MSASWRPGWGAAAVVLAALVLALPLWCVTALAMPDYPAHLAGYDLIASGAASAAVSRFYEIHWAFLPNLAGEALVPLLAGVTGLEVAAKLFITAGVLMWVAGPALVHRALHGRIGIAPLFAALFAYNANFMWGFLNYYFAMGLAFLVFAVWIAREGRRTAAQLAGFAVAVTAVYFCHLFAAATLLLLIVCFEASAWLEQRPTPRQISARLASIALVFAPAAFAFLVLKPHSGRGEVTFNLLDTWDDRLGGALQRHFDCPSYVLLAVLVVALAIALWRGWARIPPRMIPVLSVLAVATAVAPEWAMGGWGVDLRLPAVFCALLFASAELRLKRRATLALGCAALVPLGWSAAALTSNWRGYDRQYTEFRRAAHALPPGSKLVTVLDGDAIGLRSDQPYWHMAEFAIIDPGAFTPLMFTTRDQHVVRLRPAYQPLAAASAEQGSPPDVDELGYLAAGQVDEDEDIATVFPYLMHFQCHYDEAVVIHLDGRRTPIPKFLRLRHAGSFFSIYDILPSGTCGTR